MWRATHDVIKADKALCIGFILRSDSCKSMGFQSSPYASGEAESFPIRHGCDDWHVLRLRTEKRGRGGSVIYERCVTQTVSDHLILCDWVTNRLLCKSV